MSEREQESRPVGGCAFVAAMLAIVPVAYILSSGPMAAVLPNLTWQIVYMPLMFLTFHVPFLMELWLWYVHFWK